MSAIGDGTRSNRTAEEGRAAGEAFLLRVEELVERVAERRAERANDAALTSSAAANGPVLASEPQRTPVRSKAA